MKRSKAVAWSIRQERRKFLLKTAGAVVAAGALGPYVLRGYAADPVNEIQ